MRDETRCNYVSVAVIFDNAMDSEAYELCLTDAEVAVLSELFTHTRATEDV